MRFCDLYDFFRKNNNSMDVKKHIFILFLFSIIVSCKKETNSKETMLSGETTFLVDESIFPIVEDQKNVFENTYQAKIQLNTKTETEIVNSLIDQNEKVGILTRLLSQEEETYIKITPKRTKFAIDAVVFIVNKQTQDSIISLDEVYAYLNGKEQKSIKNLVFDNPNSSVVRTVFEKLNIDIQKNKTLYSKGTSAELIKFVSENEEYIGVIGINWLTQTPTELLKYSENIKILSVADFKSNNKEIHEYIFPSQANIGKKTYPLTRELFLLNYQGTTGLGMGFASFIASDIGQKIILTSGLAPVRLEPLNINIKKTNTNQ